MATQYPTDIEELRDEIGRLKIENLRLILENERLTAQIKEGAGKKISAPPNTVYTDHHCV